MGYTTQRVDKGWIFRFGDEHGTLGDKWDKDGGCFLEENTGIVWALTGNTPPRYLLAAKREAEKLLGRKPNWKRTYDMAKTVFEFDDKYLTVVQEYVDGKVTTTLIQQHGDDKAEAIKYQMALGGGAANLGLEEEGS